VLLVSVVHHQLLLLVCDPWKALALELGLDVPGCKCIKPKLTTDICPKVAIFMWICLNLLEFFQFLFILSSLSSCHVNILLLLLCWQALIHLSYAFWNTCLQKCYIITLCIYVTLTTIWWVHTSLCKSNPMKKHV